METITPLSKEPNESKKLLPLLPQRIMKTGTKETINGDNKSLSKTIKNEDTLCFVPKALNATWNTINHKHSFMSTENEKIQETRQQLCMITNWFKLWFFFCLGLWEQNRKFMIKVWLERQKKKNTLSGFVLNFIGKNIEYLDVVCDKGSLMSVCQATRGF